jgi:hypothetical protein
MTVNLASEGNAAKINQRFRELETDLRTMAQRLTKMEAMLNNQIALAETQASVIQRLQAASYAD